MDRRSVFFKSMFVHTGLSEAGQIKEGNICDVLTLIKNFVDSSEQKKKTFAELYDVLEKPPYGMRKGIIPLFIVYVMRKYKETAALYFKGKEVELDSNVLSGINEKPEEYILIVEKGTIEREEYLNSLEKLFGEYFDSSYTGMNRAFAIVKGMQTWMRSLPDYTKKFNCDYLKGEFIKADDSIKIIRNDLLKFEINAREMLFDSWKKKLSAEEKYQECVEEIGRVKEFLDIHIAEVRKSLATYLTNLFMPGYSGALSSALKLWYEKLPDATKHHVFDSEANELLLLADRWNSFDDQRLLNELSMIFVSMAIEDWTDQLEEQFVHAVVSTTERINAFIQVKNKQQDCKLAINSPEIQVEKTFTDAEISPIGKTLLNNLKAVFEEYNEAIEPDEKLAIIAKLVSDVIR